MLKSTVLFSTSLHKARLHLLPIQLLAKNITGTMGTEDGERKTEKNVEEVASQGESEKRNGVLEGRRGALVVIEGCDRTGKTTQAKMLVDFLLSTGKPAIFMRFPERSTPIGQIINSYLTSDKDLDDRAIHLLFSANRWELLSQLMSHLHAGTSVIIDRYAFSGVAFSAAKPGLSLEWCKGSDAGLPKPDLLLFLDLTPEQAQARGGYGTERYETQHFQAKVRDNYYKLKDDSWKVIDGNQSIEKLQEVLKSEVLKAVKSVTGQELGTIW